MENSIAQKKRHEYKREYRATHQEQIREYSKKYQIAHREQINKCARERYAVHPKRAKEHSREYHAAHPEQLRKWQIAHPEKTTEYKNRHRALKLHAEGNGVTAKQWYKIKEEYNYLCAYCNQKKPLAMDHIIPLAKGGRHDIDNIVPVCGSCNSHKSDSSLLMFLYRRTLCA
jgi:5-methylcytosine-specific restriction endonuclease McrA